MDRCDAISQNRRARARLRSTVASGASLCIASGRFTAAMPSQDNNYGFQYVKNITLTNTASRHLYRYGYKLGSI